MVTNKITETPEVGGSGEESVETVEVAEVTVADAPAEAATAAVTEATADEAEKPDAAAEVVVEEVKTEEAKPAEPEVVKGSDGLPLVLPLAALSPEEQFRATTRLIFLAPDVPPIDPRPRRGNFRQLDDIFEEQHQALRQHDREAEQPARRERRERRSAAPQAAPEAEPQRRQSAPVVTEPQRVKGSTRLEAKKQRRRDGRDAGRRRTVITESEFLARREAVDREMIVRSSADRIQIGVLEDSVLVEHYVARSSENSLIGNVYIGRVQNVLPSMEAAFVDIGRGRNAVLYSGEVDWSEFEGGNTARKIENALKPGDRVLVQVTKDPVGHKGARLTSQISLPGRFLVYVPGGAMNGISRKLPDTERARLKKILKEVLPSGAGVIVRTAAEGATEEQLTRDVQHLARQWEHIQARMAKGGGPALLHSEPDMLIKIVRDVFNEDFQRMVISGNDTHATISNYLEQVAPDLLQRVERYEGERDVFDKFRVTEQIAKALDRKVWLPSGGSLVIDRTEAMTVVDVNTGKFVGSGGNLEETVTKNNLEAAEEIVRQLRLRDVGGIIVIDFIDMVLESNRDLVLRRLVECLGRDRTKHQVAEVTSLGLVQMTRKKLGLGLLESFSEPCDVCAGRGVVVHHDPVSKHRNEAPRSSKRNRNNSGGGNTNTHAGNKNDNGNAQGENQSQPVAADAKAHAITDGAKNMLAQVAASTLPASPADEPAHAGSKPAVAEEKKSGKVVSGKARRGGATPAAAEPSPAANLLDSVLDALPDAPAVGTSRARRRASQPAGGSARANRATQSAGSATEDSAPQVAKDVAVDPQQLIFDALDVRVQEKASERD